MALMSLQEFRYKRDRMALDGYYQRWPELYRSKLDLWQKIKATNVQLEVKHSQHLEDEKKALWWKFQDVAGNLSALKADAKVRAERLGIRKPVMVNQGQVAQAVLM